ncbi:hypothetical protein FACS1894159_12000 [Bacteroidia bacterium]|nr:hypothetical protein FACS1894159_12000 [Bacteroidia bacterium]
MENDNTQLVITDQAKSYLFETAKWAKFLAIMGFIGLGLMVLFGLLFFIASSSAMAMMATSSLGGALGGMIFIIYGILMIVLAAIYIYPVYCLYRFSTRSQLAVISDDSLTMTESLGWLKKYYKFVGIMTIIVLSIYALAILFFIIGGIASAF